MADVISFGPDGPRRPVPRWVVAVAVVLLVGGVVAAVVRVSSNGPPKAPAGPRVVLPTAPTEPPLSMPPAAVGSVAACWPVGWGQEPSVPASVWALRIEGTPVSGKLDRCDRTFADGPWTVVVRRLDGSFGRHGAVVTYPADPVVSGRTVVVGGVSVTVGSGTVTWPVGGKPARVRGDLSEQELLAVAAATRFTDGRPRVDAPAGLVVVTSGPYRSPTIHEMRYGSKAVGEGAALGDGLMLTGVGSGGGFEDQVYASGAREGAPVDGRPSIVSPVFGGSGSIAWEPAPGLVAYVGYSGSMLDDAAVAALQRLTARARPMTATEWLADGTSIVDQTNQPG